MKDLTTAEVARILNIQRNTVSKLVKEGKLTPYRITEGTGRMRLRIKKEEAVKLLFYASTDRDAID